MGQAFVGHATAPFTSGAIGLVIGDRLIPV